MGLNENQKTNNVFIYPNSAENYIQIDGKENFANKNYRIFDMTGKRILNGIIDFQQKISLESLSKGTYNLVIDDEYIFKLIKN